MKYIEYSSGRDRTNVALRTRDGVLFLYNLISDGK